MGFIGSETAALKGLAQLQFLNALHALAFPPTSLRVSLPNPRNPLHLDTIEGWRNIVSGGQIAENIL